MAGAGWGTRCISEPLGAAGAARSQRGVQGSTAVLQQSVTVKGAAEV